MECMGCKTTEGTLITFFLPEYLDQPEAEMKERTVCDACLQDRYYFCEECEVLCDDDKVAEHRDDDGNTYCRDCFVCTSCADCDVVYRTDDVDWHVIRGEQICERCFNNNYMYCHRCDNAVHYDNTRTIDNEYTWCERCANCYSYWCDHCDTSHPDDYRCRSDGPELDVNYYDYTWVPSTRDFLKLPNEHEPLFFGWELEMEVTDDERELTRLSEMIDQKSRWLVVKKDGSLSERGVELVSKPMSWSWIQRNRKDLMAFLENLGKHGCYVTEDCGFHVHVSRDYLTKMHLYRMMRLMYYFPDFVQNIAGRDYYSLNRWANTRTPRKILLETCKFFHSERRYTALNVPLQKNTTEFRIFNGTVNAKAVFSNLEFCHAVREFTFRHNVRDIVPSRFRDWVNARIKRYPELVQTLARLPSVAFNDTPNPPVAR